MRDYSLDELEMMQEKALQRVEHMHARSKAFVNPKIENQYTDEIPASISQTNASPPKEEKTPFKSGRISMPLNLPKDRDLVYPSFKEQVKKHNDAQKELREKTKKSNFFDTVLQEPDAGLLFCLLLLLKAEGNNESLILSLLYILF